MFHGCTGRRRNYLPLPADYRLNPSTMNLIYSHVPQGRKRSVKIIEITHYQSLRNGNRFLFPDTYPPLIEFVQYKEQDGERNQNQEILRRNIGGVKDILNGRNGKKQIDPDELYDNGDDEEFIGE